MAGLWNATTPLWVLCVTLVLFDDGHRLNAVGSLLALGALVLGEPLRWNQPVGAADLITGIAVSQGRLCWRASRESAPPPPGARAVADAGES
jgi:drug/metabolite transporter (DMT)-like permease